MHPAKADEILAEFSIEMAGDVAYSRTESGASALRELVADGLLQFEHAILQPVPPAWQPVVIGRGVTNRP